MKETPNQASTIDSNNHRCGLNQIWDQRRPAGRGSGSLATEAEARMGGSRGVQTTQRLGMPQQGWEVEMRSNLTWA